MFCRDSFPFAMITLRWEQMERAQEVDLLVVAVLCSLDQPLIALLVVFIALMPLFYDFLL